MKKKTKTKARLERIPATDFDADVVYLEEQDDSTFAFVDPPLCDQPNFKPPGVWSKSLFSYDLIVVAKPDSMPAKRKRALRMSIADIKHSIRRKNKSLKSLERLLEKEITDGNKKKKPAKAKQVSRNKSS